VEHSNKLYKCYKPGCNKADDSDNPYLTQSEYDELIVDGKLICPENHEACGIQELKPEDYPKPPKDNKKLFLIGGGILVILLIAIGGILFLNRGSKKLNKPVVENIITKVPDNNVTKAEPPPKEEKSVETPKVKVKEEDPPPPPPPPPPPAPPTKGKLHFPYGDYIGDLKNGKMDGLGVLKFTERQLISKKDPKKRFAEPGDYLDGVWFEGFFVNGKMFKQDGTLKETIIIGH